MKKQIIKKITKILSEEYPTYKVVYNNSITTNHSYTQISTVADQRIVTLTHDVGDTEFLYFNEIK